MERAGSGTVMWTVTTHVIDPSLVLQFHGMGGCEANMRVEVLFFNASEGNEWCPGLKALIGASVYRPCQFASYFPFAVNIWRIDRVEDHHYSEVDIVVWPAHLRIELTGRVLMIGMDFLVRTPRCGCEVTVTAKGGPNGSNGSTALCWRAGTRGIVLAAPRL